VPLVHSGITGLAVCLRKTIKPSEYFVPGRMRGILGLDVKSWVMGVGKPILDELIRFVSHIDNVIGRHPREVG
jgi:hypothetical protein